MSRGNDNDFIALIGSKRSVNHSGRSKPQYYRKFPYEGSPCVRLKVIDEILPDEVITVFYGSDFFDYDNINCQCPNHASIKPKQTPSRQRRIELPALSESRFHSRIFNFVFAHRREVSDSSSSTEENVGGILSSCLANSGLHFIETPFQNFLEGENDADIEPGSSVFVEFRAECDVLESDCTCSAGAASKRSLQVKLPSGYRRLVENIFVLEATLSLLAIVLKHCCSDEYLYDLVRRERLIMDSKKNRSIPTLGFFKNILKNAPHVLIRDLDRNENGDFARLNFHIILLDTVESNLNAILEFHQTEDVDLKLLQLLKGDTLSIPLILNSDGCQLIESLAKLSLWPLWSAVVDLPPMKRAAFSYITPLSLFFWQRKPGLSKSVR